ncbi:unnamed protein product [Heligmosomoides polygyrus]|uniref:G_PROTEIN_RECEP_F1_2 domain-containing protein n=1 Tax=Heligmosomoides polygyrus TaxID=6339 RepID=A0A183F7H0_HELPZ|nr:unnamed protein product [Heligmosomoides polygyrus]
MYPFSQLSARRSLSDRSASPDQISFNSSRKLANSQCSPDLNGIHAHKRSYRTTNRIASSWRGACVSRSLYPVLMTLQILALFPNTNSSQKHRWRRVTRLILMLNYSALAVLFNSYLLNKNMWLITAYKVSNRRKSGVIFEHLINRIRPHL